MAIAGKFIGGLIFAAAALLAQAPQAGVLVRLNVAALDANGEPVLDLKPDDLQIFDQAKQERIAFFRTPDAAKAAPLGPREYSNLAGGAPPHSTAILFDLMNENQMDRLDVWHELGRSLQQLESGDSLYFYLLNLEGTLVPIHAIGAKSDDDKTWTQQVEKTLDKAMKSASHARPAGLGDEDMVKKTYVALETIGNQLAPLPGRRDIIWITNGVPQVSNPKTPCSGDWVDCALYVPHLAVTLARDNVAVNPLSYTSSPDANMTRDLEDMASLTGGWTYHADDIRAAIQQVVRDGATGYTVAYDPGAENWDSKFHKIRLACERKGVKLHAKFRYYAYPDQRPALARRQAALAAVYQSAFDSADIGVLATAALASAGGQKTVHLQMKIQPADILLHEEGGQFTGGLTFVLGNFGANGSIGEPMVSNSSLHLTREQRETVAKDGIPIALDQPITDAVQKVRVLVLDQAATTVGSVSIPIGELGSGK